MDSLDVIFGRGEFPLYLHTHTSYKGYHISYPVSENLSIGLKWLEC